MQAPIIDLNKVSVFNQSNLVLKNVNLKVSKGEFVFLIGKTGTGKSSLIRVLYGDLPVLEGNATVVGKMLNNLKERKIPSLRRKIGVVFQDFKLLNDRTIFDNLTFVLKATRWKKKEAIKERIEEVMAMVGVDVALTKYPFELSGGEQQRIAIARSLLNAPELIIADEPTGNLDPETSQEIMRLFSKLHKQGMTILMATHDYNMIVKFPGRIFKCEGQEVFEVVAKS